ncbi:UNVERIFIED_CONTAM: hypothetical protein FKN15_054096 [Acipenser sinensis]
MAEKQLKIYFLKGPGTHLKVAFVDRGSVRSERPSDLCFSPSHLHVLEVLCGKFQPPTPFADSLRACQNCSKPSIGLKQRSTDLNGESDDSHDQSAGRRDVAEICRSFRGEGA